MQYQPQDITNDIKLAGELRCDHALITHLIEKTVPLSMPAKTFFNVIKLPKRNASLGFRIVYSVIPFFAQNAFKVLKFYLDDLYKPLACVHGFVKNRNILTNAQEHINKKSILNIDIKNFFESITKDNVKAVFSSLGFNMQIAEILSQITTVQDKLVAGLSTSSVIANLYCQNMDKELYCLAKQNNITYTRYADDLTFSGNKVDIFDDIIKILQNHGFKINNTKTRHYYKGKGQYVTGLSVDDTYKPRIPKRIKKKLRAEIYCINKYGLTSDVAKTLNIDESKVDRTMLMKRIAKIVGWISFIRGIEPEFAEKCYRNLSQIQDSNFLNYLHNAKDYIESKGKLSLNSLYLASNFSNESMS